MRVEGLTVSTLVRLVRWGRASATIARLKKQAMGVEKCILWCRQIGCSKPEIFA